MRLHHKLITFGISCIFITLLWASPAKELSSMLERAEARLAVSTAEAMQIADSALSVSKAEANELAQARSLLILAKAHHQTGIYDKAIQRALEALRIYESLRD